MSDLGCTPDLRPATDLDPVAATFSVGGYLATALPGYSPRPGQVALSRAVYDAIRTADHLIVEGPTGTGKSFAYLVPAIAHAATASPREVPCDCGSDPSCRFCGGAGVRSVPPLVVVATANIALQEQLVAKDLPFLRGILPWAFDFALFKGKNNYLCLDRYRKVLGEQAQTEMFDARSRGDLSNEERALCEWAEKTTAGDKSELDFIPTDKAWHRFSVGADDCKGRRCRLYKQCFAVAARQRALACQVLVVNYHLLFANLKFGGNVLPPYDVAILDEAHEAANIARDFLGFHLSGAAFVRLSKALERAGLPSAGPVARAGEDFFESLKYYAQHGGYDVRLRRANPIAWTNVASILDDAVEDLKRAESNAPSEDAAAEFEIERNRAKNVRENLAQSMLLSDPNLVVSIETDRKGRPALVGKPIDVSGMLAKNFFAPTPTVVLTSATLATNGSFDYVVGEVGMLEPKTSIVETPFDYRKQAMLIVPRDIPDPRSDEFADAVAETIVETIRLARGRTLCLFTSYRLLNHAHDFATAHVREHQLLRQGDRPRTQLVEEFKADESSCLFGTASFWAGVDVPGASLSCVVIDKLPFPSPGDPVLDAIGERLKGQSYTSSAFFRHSIPRAIIQFKQGVGRLIRSVGDRGVIVCLDRRIREKSYGQMFVRSLPSMPLSADLFDVARFLGTGVPEKREDEPTPIFDDGDIPF